MDNCTNFTREHKLVLYLTIFPGLDAKTIHARVLEFEKNDKTSYNLTPDRIEKLYEKIKVIFNHNGSQLFKKFLDGAVFDAASDKEIIKNNPEIMVIRGKFWEDINLADLTAEKVYKKEKRHIEIPEKDFEKCLDEVDIMLLQRGNISARNRMLVKILRLVSYFVRSPYGRYLVNKYGSPDDYADLEQQVAEKCLEKLAMVDPAKGRMSTYIGVWIKSIMQRYAYELELIRAPVDANEILRVMEKKPNASDVEIARLFHGTFSLSTIARLRRYMLTEHRNVTSIDAQLSRDEREGGKIRVVSDHIADVKVPSPLEATIAISEKELINRVLSFLPPRDRILLERVFYNDESLASIGRKLKITRERVRQIQDNILKKLDNVRSNDNNNVRRGTDSGNIRTNIVSVCNEKAFTAWCDKNKLSQELRACLKLYLGLEESFDFRRLSPKQITDHLGKQNGCVDSQANPTKKRQIQDALQRMTATLERDLDKLPEKEKFLQLTNPRIMYAKAKKLLHSRLEN